MHTESTRQPPDQRTNPAILSIMHAERPTALLSLELLMGFVALACGGLLVIDGMGMPVSVLADSPFDSFLIPGLLLGGVVGGSLLLAARLVWFGHRLGPIVSVIAGCILLGWILVEAVMVRDGRPLQAAVAVYAFTLIVLGWRFARRARP
jgi:hypothetical protein